MSIEFDFCEVLNDIDVKSIEIEVRGMSQVVMERKLNNLDEITKSENWEINFFEYEIREINLYKKLINEKMLDIKSNELICI